MHKIDTLRPINLLLLVFAAGSVILSAGQSSGHELEILPRSGLQAPVQFDEDIILHKHRDEGAIRLNAIRFERDRDRLQAKLNLTLRSGEERQWLIRVTFPGEAQPSAEHTVANRVIRDSSVEEEDVNLTFHLGRWRGLSGPSPFTLELYTLKRIPLGQDGTSFVFATETPGIELGISSGEKTYELGGPVKLRYKLVNRTTESIRVQDPISVSSSASAYMWGGGAVQLAGPEGRKVFPARSQGQGAFGGGEVVVHEVPPSSSREGEIDLNDYFEFKESGEYRASLALQVYAPPTNESRKVSSGKISLQVR